MTKQYITVTQAREILDDVICNLCGKSCKTAEGNIEALTFAETWGYGSPWDCESWDGHLCMGCARKFEEWLTAQGGHIDKKDDTVKVLCG